MIKRFLSYFVIGSVFFFLIKAGLNSWDELYKYSGEIDINYLIFLLSLALIIFGMLLSGFVWGRLIMVLRPELKVRPGQFIKIFAYSIFGRYVPGKAWEFAGRSYLAAKQGIDFRTSFVSVFYELIFLTIIGGILLLISPRIILRLINSVLEKIKKEKIPSSQFLDRKNILKFTYYYLIVYVFIGLSFSFLVKSVLPSITYLQFLKFGIEYVAALIVGTAALFAPAGLGVREGFLVLFMQNDLPTGLSAIIAILSRGWAILAEIILFLMVWIYSGVVSKREKF